MLNRPQERNLYVKRFVILGVSTDICYFIEPDHIGLHDLKCALFVVFGTHAASGSGYWFICLENEPRSLGYSSNVTFIKKIPHPADLDSLINGGLVIK